MARQPNSTLAIDALAVMRLTRLVTRDRLTKRMRKAAVSWQYQRGGQSFPDVWDDLGPTVVTDDPDAPMGAYLLSCDWCSSVYVAVAVLALRRLVPGVWDPIARALAASQLTGMAAG